MLTTEERSLVIERLKTYPKGIARSWGEGPMLGVMASLKLFSKDECMEHG